MNEYKKPLYPDYLYNLVTKYEAIRNSKLNIDQAERVRLQDILTEFGYFDPVYQGINRNLFYKSAADTNDKINSYVDEFDQWFIDNFEDPDEIQDSKETARQSSERGLTCSDGRDRLTCSDGLLGIELHDIGAFLGRMDPVKKKPKERKADESNPDDYGYRKDRRHSKEFLIDGFNKGYYEFLILFPWTIGMGVVDVDGWNDWSDVEKFIENYPPLFIAHSKSGKYHCYYPASQPHSGTTRKSIKGITADFLCQSTYVGIYESFEPHLKLINDWLNDQIKPELVISYEDLLDRLGMDLPEHENPQPVRFQDQGSDVYYFEWVDYLHPVYDESGEIIIGFRNDKLPHLGFIPRNQDRSILLQWISEAKRGNRLQTISACLFNLGYQIQDRCITESMESDVINEQVGLELLCFADEFKDSIDQSESPYTYKEVDSNVDHVMSRLKGRLAVRIKNYKSYLGKQERMRRCWNLLDLGWSKESIMDDLGIKERAFYNYKKVWKELKGKSG